MKASGWLLCTLDPRSCCRILSSSDSQLHSCIPYVLKGRGEGVWWGGQSISSKFTRSADRKEGEKKKMERISSIGKTLATLRTKGPDDNRESTLWSVAS